MLDFIDINGRVVSGDERKLGVHDLATMRGYGIFDFFPVVQGKAVFEIDYFDRLYQSAERIKLKVPVDRKTLASRISHVCQANGLVQGFIKIVLTAGYSVDGASPSGKGNIIIICYPPKDDQAIMSAGVGLRLQRFDRDQPEVKSLNYMNSIQQYPELQKHGFLDVLYHSNGRITETARGNFFLIDENDQLITPGVGILQGITRKHLLHIAKDIMPIVVRPVQIEEILYAKESFITSTTKYVMPVTKINNWVIADGKPGAKTKDLFETFVSYVDQYVEENIYQRSVT